MTEKHAISLPTIERDLKALLQSEERFAWQTTPIRHSPDMNVKDAVELFDRLREKENRTARETIWTNTSVIGLNELDPISAIIQRARRTVLDAIEHGWSGPPYNPFTLAEMLGIKLIPTDSVIDAQTKSDSAGRFITKFNPQRPVARMRYSIAHEIGHTLFPDCAAAVRNRATHQDMKNDDWQLEFLCNMAAAEILIPFGTLSEELSIRPSVGLVLDLRRKYLVSSEALINRLIRLTVYPCIAFFARRDPSSSHYFIEYKLASSTMSEGFNIKPGFVLPQTSKISQCAAIGVTRQEDARWISNKQWFVEYLGISPYPGDNTPRVLGLAFPPFAENTSPSDRMTFVRGDASEPVGADMKLLLQVVNDQAMIWGGGFAKQARKKWPRAQTQYREWAFGRGNLKLGNIHVARVREDLTLVSLICQHGFGQSAKGPRLRYASLATALSKVAEIAMDTKASVHMPRIGTGDAGGSWKLIEGMIREILGSEGVAVTVYDLKSHEHDVARQPSFEFPAQMVDEVV
jgi:Zn-dependent peptidase ImmA (M78 family)/O-acetyl-ADP-ribose deacetylase (regulator of RNase III)